ncbi:CASP-like protein N24, partial [Mucuna pruriens]
MTTTKNENLAQEKKGDKMKRYSESEEKEEEVKPSKKKEQQHNHPVSESPLRSITYKASKHPSAPTLQDSFNKSHSHHSMSDGDLQIVVASHSHSHSHSQSVSEGTINVVKEETKAVMDKEEGTHDDGVSKKESKWFIVLMGLRITAFLFCKLAFSVLASDHRKKVRPVSSWYDYDEESSSQLHWYDFKEFKYCLSVNIIGFVYSALQLCDMVKYLITKRHTVDPKLRGYFNFAMDQ